MNVYPGTDMEQDITPQNLYRCFTEKNHQLCKQDHVYKTHIAVADTNINNTFCKKRKKNL